MSNICKTRPGMTTGNTNANYINNNVKLEAVGTNTQPLSMFNSDGSVQGQKSRYAGTKSYVNNVDWNNENKNQINLGGENMKNENLWTTKGTFGSNAMPSGVGKAGDLPKQWSFVNGAGTAQTTTTQTTPVVNNSTTPTITQPVNQPVLSPSGADWGNAVNNNQQTQQTTMVNGQPVVDLAANAIAAIKKLAGSILEIVPHLNDEKFNELVKVYEFAGLKDEFLEMSGRKNSYLDRPLLTEALNEINMVFTENNNNNANLNNTLNNIVNVLNTTGSYDARNVYDFIDLAMRSGVIPQTIWNDPMRRNLAKVCNMAANYKRANSGVGETGADWGNRFNNNNMNNNQVQPVGTVRQINTSASYWPINGNISSGATTNFNNVNNNVQQVNTQNRVVPWYEQPQGQMINGGVVGASYVNNNVNMNNSSVVQPNSIAQWYQTPSNNTVQGNNGMIQPMNMSNNALGQYYSNNVQQVNTVNNGNKEWWQQYVVQNNGGSNGVMMYTSTQNNGNGYVGNSNNMIQGVQNVNNNVGSYNFHTPGSQVVQQTSVATTGRCPVYFN